MGNRRLFSVLTGESPTRGHEMGSYWRGLWETMDHAEGLGPWVHGGLIIAKTILGDLSQRLEI